jgi:hypothetical protein
MKQRIVLCAAALVAASLLCSGCIAVMGGNEKKEATKPTVGRQLVDLKAARDSGALTDTEYQAQKAKILEHK